MEKNGHFHYDQRNSKRLKDVDRMSVRSGNKKRKKKASNSNLDKWSKSYVQNTKNFKNKRHKIVGDLETIKKQKDKDGGYPYLSEFEVNKKKRRIQERWEMERDYREADFSKSLGNVHKAAQMQNNDWQSLEQVDQDALSEKIFKKKKPPKIDRKEDASEENKNQKMQEMILNIPENSHSSAEHESETQNKVPKAKIFRETMEDLKEDGSTIEKETTKINNGPGTLSYNELSQMVESLREENSQLRENQVEVQGIMESKNLLEDHVQQFKNKVLHLEQAKGDDDEKDQLMIKMKENLEGEQSNHFLKQII